MDSPQVQPNCNSKEQPSMQKQQALATHKNLQTTWALTKSHRDGTGFHILYREGHPPEARAAQGPVLGIVRITASARYALLFLGIHTRYTLQMPGIHM